METIVSRTLSVHKEHELLMKLETAGLNNELAQRVVDSKGNDLATKVVRLIQNGGFEPTTSQKFAREIMGKNFFGIEDAIKHFGINPTPQQLAALSEVPFSEAVLEESKSTHVLVAVFPLSILEIRSKVASNLFCKQSWYNEEPFANYRGGVNWHLVRKTPVKNSTYKNWNEQQALLPENEETPKAQVTVFTLIGHFLVSRDTLFEQIHVRCLDLDSRGNRVLVGYFAPAGLCIDGWRSLCGHSIGLASVRKFN